MSRIFKKSIIVSISLALLLPQTSYAEESISKKTKNIEIIKSLLERNVKYSSEIKNSSCIIQELFLSKEGERRYLNDEEIEIDKVMTLPNNALEGVNINLHCQYGFMVKNGEIIKIFPVSTGRKGMETKKGVFKIYYRYNGWWESTLYPGAMMYKPQYFYKNIGIHGMKSDTSVRPYPDSHGCVRVERKIADFIWSNSRKGDTVRVYGEW